MGFAEALYFIRGPTHVAQTDVWESRRDTLNLFQKTRRFNWKLVYGGGSSRDGDYLLRNRPPVG